ncbi:MAG: hypothetical protein KDK45_02080 [Leptospiraceae bacterium]|nr:hypothetical protein [Leptospiraceae bacterium]
MTPDGKATLQEKFLTHLETRPELMRELIKLNDIRRTALIVRKGEAA